MSEQGMADESAAQRSGAGTDVRRRSPSLSLTA